MPSQAGKRPLGPTVRLQVDLAQRGEYKAKRAGITLEEWVNGILEAHFIDCNTRDRLKGLDWIHTSQKADDLDT